MAYQYVDRRLFEFDEALHPRDPKGSDTGGQFTSNPKSSTKQPAKRRPAGRRDGEQSTGSGVMGYNPDTGRGTGYGRAGGDSRVRALQEALNRLGVRDSQGRRLKVDGKLGPLTTQAVKAAQRRMGITADGRVDADMLASLAKTKSLPRKSKSSKCVCRSVECVDDGCDEKGPAMVEAVVERADDPKKPYGDVEYADPGYQDDGKKRYPIDSEEHCRAAWSYINQADNAAKYSPDELSKVKGRIKAAGKKYGIEFSDDESRSEVVEPVAEILRYERSWALDDIAIRSSGDGRTVEAYAAVFDVQSEIRDQHGHYIEVIDRKAFNRAISHGIERVSVFYNHGYTIHGNADMFGSVPIGSPVDIRPDGKGLRTVTRFNKGQLADTVLEAIRNGDIRGYSFRGRIFQSNPNKIPRSRPGTSLPTVTRTELGLSEYGPTPTPAYADAGILAVRSVEALAARFAALAVDERAELMRILSVPTPTDPDDTTPVDPETDTATPDVGPGAEDSPEDIGRSGRKAKLAEILARVGQLK